MSPVECDHGEVFGPGFACPARRRSREYSMSVEFPFAVACPWCDATISVGTEATLIGDDYVCPGCAG